MHFIKSLIIIDYIFIFSKEKVINSLQIQKKHLFLHSQTPRWKNNNAKYTKQ
jgi:hypothetical protein